MDYVKAVLAKQPVGYWRLGETTGTTAVDSSGNGRDGEYVGAVALQQPGAISGDDNTAIQISGQRAFVEIPSHDDFSQPTSKQGLTVEVWMRPSSFNFEGEEGKEYIHWLGKGKDKQQEWALRFHNQKSQFPHRIAAYIFNPCGKRGAGAYFKEEPPSDGNTSWIHIVACFDPGDASDPCAGVRIYRNGSFKKGPQDKATLYNKPGDWEIYPAPGYAPLRLGTRECAKYLSGWLDEVAIYPRVLSSQEILENYNAGIDLKG